MQSQPRCRIDHLPEQAAQIPKLDADVGEVYLAPRLAETPRRIPEHGIPARDELVVPGGRTVLAAPVAVQVDDERIGSGCKGNPDRDVERRAIHLAGEEACAIDPGRRRRTRQSQRRACSGEGAGTPGVAAEGVRRREGSLCKQREGRESCEQAAEDLSPDAHDDRGPMHSSDRAQPASLANPRRLR